MSTKRNALTVKFIWLCAIVYFVSYITRNNYNSAISEITVSMGTTKDITGLVSTSAFLTYGFGQIICGFIGDYIKPRYMILMGITATSVCNILMPFMSWSIVPMIVLWGINGFAQAMFWPPLVRMMAEHLSGEDYNQAVVTVSMASSVGNIIVYLLSPLCIAVSGWRLIFYITGGVGLAMVALWFMGTKKLPAPILRKAETGKEENSTDAPAQNGKVSIRKMAAASGLVCILIAIILQGMLRDGLTTWMPSLLTDTFELPSVVSILTGIVLPIFAMVSFKIAAKIQDKLHNELLCAGILFGAGFVFAVIMLPLFSLSAVASVILTSLITGCMHGVNLMLITRIPIHFARFGKISSMSGILNAFTYIGSAFSTYGFALLADRYGWYFTIASWAITSAIGAVLCLIIVKKWKKFTA